MATFEHIMFIGGPLDGQTKQGAFKERIYLNANLDEVQPAIAQDAPMDTHQLQHRYRRGQTAYEFHYEGYE